MVNGDGPTSDISAPFPSLPPSYDDDIERRLRSNLINVIDFALALVEKDDFLNGSDLFAGNLERTSSSLQ